MSDLQVTPDATPAMERLDKEINFLDFVEWISEGKGYKRFGREVAKCGMAVLHKWANATPERKALIDQAQDSIAEAYVEQGEECLLTADTSNKETASANVSLAKALDNHYRWKASKHGRKYSDSLKLQGDKDNPFSVSMTVEKIERVIVDPKAAPQR